MQAFEHAQRAEPGRVARIFRQVETDPDMALGAEMIDLVGLQVVDQVGELPGIGQIAVMDEKPDVLSAARIDIKVADTRGVEAAGPAHDAVDLISLVEQEFRQIGAVLAGNPRNQSLFHRISPSAPRRLANPPAERRTLPFPQPRRDRAKYIAIVNQWLSRRGGSIEIFCKSKGHSGIRRPLVQ